MEPLSREYLLNLAKINPEYEEASPSLHKVPKFCYGLTACQEICNQRDS